MKFLPLVWAGIWRKPGRTVLTLLSVTNAFLLFGILQGFANGLGGAVAATHADVLLTQSRVSQTEPLPISLLSRIQSVPGVRAVSPVVFFHGGYRTALPVNVRGFGVDPARFVAANPDETIPPDMVAALKRTRTGAIVPSGIADKFGWTVGDHVPLKSALWINRDGTSIWPLDIVGIYTANPKDALFGSALLVNYDYVDQARIRSVGTTSIFLVRVADPTRAAEVARAIDTTFANSVYETRTVSEHQMAADSIKQIGDVGYVVRSVVGAVFFALIFSVTTIMMHSIRERTPELALLKTFGFTDGGILRLILAETLTFYLFAAGLGLGLAQLMLVLVKVVTGFDMHTGPVLALGAALATAFGFVSGLPPALRGMRLTVVDALAGR